MNIRAIRCVAVACKLCGSECSKPMRPKPEATKASRSGPYTPQAKVTLGTLSRGGLVTPCWGPPEIADGHCYGRTSQGSRDIRGVAGGSYLIQGRDIGDNYPR